MSSAVSGLRRFDVTPSRTVLTRFSDLSVPVAPVHEIEPSAEQIRETDIPQPELREEAAHPLDEALASTLDQLIQALNVAKGVVDQEIRQAVSEIATSLLPTLAQKGFAEEIVQQLPSLVSVKARTVNLKCSPKIATKLSTLIGKSPDLNQRCTISVDSDMELGRVDISWGEGGVTYDLNATLADLISTQTFSKS